MKLFLLSLLSLGLLSANEAFISAEKLNSLLPKANIVLIDVGTQDSFLNKGHIPGAINSQISEWRMPVKQHFLMRPQIELIKKVSALGISNDTKVVIYGHGGPKEILKASYIALTLKVLGHKDVSILNGGFEEWTYHDDSEISHEVTANNPSHFKASIRDDIIVDKSFVLKNLNKIAMMEARPSKFYFGLTQSKGVKRKGHISGGMSYFWKNNFEADETIKSYEEIVELLVQGMLLDPKKEMMVYCTGGLEASMNWYVLTQVLGFKDVKIYDASLKEWGNLDDTPMTYYRWEAFAKK